MTDYWRNWTCGRCGAPSTVGDDEGGWAMCDRCEADYQASLDAQYPHGFCHECGAAYFLHTNRDGSQEYRAWHAEGGCSQWRDYADEDYYEDLAAEEAREAEEGGPADDPDWEHAMGPRNDREAAAEIEMEREAAGRVDPNPVYEDTPSRIPGPKVDPAWVHQDGQGLVLDDDDLPF